MLCANTWKSGWSWSGTAHFHDCGLSIIFHRNKRGSLSRPLTVILFILGILQQPSVSVVLSNKPISQVNNK